MGRTTSRLGPILLGLTVLGIGCEDGAIPPSSVVDPSGNWEVTSTLDETTCPFTVSPTLVEDVTVTLDDGWLTYTDPRCDDPPIVADYVAGGINVTLDVTDAVLFDFGTADCLYTGSVKISLRFKASTGLSGFVEAEGGTFDGPTCSASCTIVYSLDGSRGGPGADCP